MHLVERAKADLLKGLAVFLGWDQRAGDLDSSLMCLQHNVFAALPPNSKEGHSEMSGVDDDSIF